MPVIAALDRERQAHAERAENVRRPRPERQHRLRRIQRPGIGVDPPVGAIAPQ